jgi:hypothetical protein
LEPHWDPATFPLGQAEPAPLEQTPDIDEQTQIAERVSLPQDNSAPPWWDGSAIEIARATRSWIQYGTVAFAVICIVIGAVEALVGR